MTQKALRKILFWPIGSVKCLNSQQNLLYSMFNPSGTKGGGGGGGGVENDPHEGFSSVIFARGMILKPNFRVKFWLIKLQIFPERGRYKLSRMRLSFHKDWLS